MYSDFNYRNVVYLLILKRHDISEQYHKHNTKVKMFNH